MILASSSRALPPETGGSGDPLPLSAINPFNAISACNRPIGDATEYSGVTAVVTDWRKGTSIYINSGNNYGHRWIEADSNDFLVSVTSNGNGSTGLPVSVRIPAGFTGGNSNGGDRGASIWNLETGRVDQFYQFFRVNDTTATAAGHYNYDPAGVDYGAPRKSSSASWICQLGLTLRGDEVNDAVAPEIHHALNVALGYRPIDDFMQLSREVIWPANGTDGVAFAKNAQGEYINNNGNIPYGALMAVPPESRGGPNLEAVIPASAYRQQVLRVARACVNYGIYVVDGSSMTMRGDNHINSSVHPALVAGLSALIPHFRQVLGNVAGTTVAGAGAPLVPNRAYDA